MKVGIVIPAYNVADRLADVLLESCKHVSLKHIYVVDDGSTDSTAKVAVHAGVVLCQHQTNRGKGEALKSGFRMALRDDLDGIMTLDGDGQHDPDFIPEFISTMEKTQSDFVLGRRKFQIGNMPMDRIFSNWASSLIVSLVTGKRIQDSQCGYRLIRRSVLESVPLFSSFYETETELLIKAMRGGYTVSFCPISTHYIRTPSSIRRFTDSRRFCQLIWRLIRERHCGS